MLKYCWGCRTYSYYDTFFKAYICRCGKETVQETENEELELEEKIEDDINKGEEN